MPLRFRKWLAVLLAMMALAASPARADLPPRPDGPVLDQAGVIPDAEELALDSKLREYTKATGRSVIVATVSSLDGLEDEEYAQTLAEAWGIGGKTTEEGVLLLVAPGERKLRIHNGRGVQDRLTDAMSGRIIRDTMVPQFKQGNFAAGIAAGVDQIIATLNMSPAEAKAIAEAEAAARAKSGSSDNGTLASAGFWIVMFLVFMFIFGGRRRGGMRSGIDPGIVLWGVSEAARHMSGRSGSSDFGGFGSGDSFGGFGGGGGGFDGGGASGDW